LALAPDEPVGESWEVSVEPSFPSLLESGEALADAIARQPIDWLGPEVARKYGSQLPLLLKLVDAKDKLSVQVHPPLMHPSLEPDESGKLEAWLVLDAVPNAGIYLGFQDHVTRRLVEDCLRADGPLNELMNFVLVQSGDVYVIRPGTAHCLMGGITVAEPQLLVPGKRTVTYRYWDWNRLYDDRGRVFPGGRGRELHVQHSLDVTEWAGVRGQALVSQLRAVPTIVPGSFERLHLVQEGGLWAESWRGSGSEQIAPPSLLAVTCLDGHLDIATADLVLPLEQGETAVVPALARDVTLCLRNAYALLSSVVDG
jgi:mannose-6-phosphate isomerase